MGRKVDVILASSIGTAKSMYVEIYIYIVKRAAANLLYFKDYRLYTTKCSC